MHMISLPLEVLCHIFSYLSPHHSYQLCLTSRSLSRAFYCNIDAILKKVIEEFGCLIFECPQCKAVVRGGAEITSVVVVIFDDGVMEEKLYRTCKKCRRHIKKNHKCMEQMLEKYYNDDTKESKFRKIAYAGLSNGGDTNFVMNVVKVVYGL